MKTAATALLLASGLAVGSPSTNGTCKQTKVLILGAGTAGITAGQALTNKSITDFMILEYNNHVGGRAFHQPFGKKADGKPYIIEYGANWIQGVASAGGPINPIEALSQKINLQNTYSNYSNLSTYDQHGFNDYNYLLDDYNDAYTGLEQDAGMISDQGLVDNNAKVGLSLSGWTPGRNMLKQAIDWWQWDFEDAYSPEKSSELFGVQGYNASRYAYSESDYFVTDQRGYNAFIKALAATYLKPSDPRLHLNTIVTNVSYTDKGVTVTTKNGTCYQADYAICTFSLGVLQNSLAGTADVSFSPALPRWKQQAIQGFDMAIYTKIFYQFPSQFWDDTTQYYLYADPSTRGYYPLWQSLSLPGFFPNSSIIFCTVTDDMSRRVEMQSDNQTRDEGLAVLRKMFPDKHIPEPTAFVYPRWGSTPWAFGSYSNWPTGYGQEAHDNLRAGVANGRLRFAGEATSDDFYGFLQGAYFEGRDAANQVAICMGKSNGTCDNGGKFYNPLSGAVPPANDPGATGNDDGDYDTY